jgi:hypothetical protein
MNLKQTLSYLPFGHNANAFHTVLGIRIWMRRIRMVFVPPGFVNHKYGSGSFYRQAKII